LKNLIAQNLYIFDSPEETWDNERLDKLHIEDYRGLQAFIKSSYSKFSK
jgi:hypothetical protein